MRCCNMSKLTILWWHCSVFGLTDWPLLTSSTCNLHVSNDINRGGMKGRGDESIPEMADWWQLRADSRFVRSQWETVLLCNAVSHWLGANLKLPSQQECIMLEKMWELLMFWYLSSFVKYQTVMSYCYFEQQICALTWILNEGTVASWSWWYRDSHHTDLSVSFWKLAGLNLIKNVSDQLIVGLTHCGSVTPYDDTDLGQPHHAITWTTAH